MEAGIVDSGSSGNSGTALISSEIYFWSLQILHVPLLVFILLGALTNGVNVVVFVKQGVSSGGITWALFAMAVINFLASIVLLPNVVCFYVHRINLDLSNGCSIVTLATTFPHFIWNKATCFLTTYICVERAICVVFPLRVNTLLQIKIRVLIVVCLCMVTTAIYICFPASIRVVWRPDHSRNGTVTAQLEPSEFSDLFYRLNFVFNSLVVSNVAIVIIASATVVMVTRLNAARKWRDSTIRMTAHPRPGRQPKSQGRMTSKSLELCRTVTVITTFYLTCLVCSHLPAMMVVTLPGVTIDGDNSRLLDIILTIRYDIDALHASVNLFFYFKLSSKFRESFYSVFCSHKSSQ